MKFLWAFSLSIALAGQFAYAKDLGFYDSYLSGVNAKNTPTKLVFDIYGDNIRFTPDRLEVEIGKNTKKLIAKLSKRDPYFDASSASGGGWISPSQVVSYDYHVQHGMGIAFKIYYQARNGQMSVASFVFRDENTAMSFHKTMLKWINGQLSLPEKTQ
jgi:hypothetical protein